MTSAARTSSIRWRLAVLCAAILSLAAPAYVAAQGSDASPAPAPTASPEAEYRKLIAAAVRAFDQGRWADAHRLFVESHAIKPSARTLRGIGLSAYKMGALAEAYTALEAALASNVNPLQASLRSEVASVHTLARRGVALLSVYTKPTDAQITVDGDAARFDIRGHVVVTPGPHVVAATLDDRRVDNAIDVEAGTTFEVRLTVPSAAETVAASPGDSPSATSGTALDTASESASTGGAQANAAAHYDASDSARGSAPWWAWAGVGALGAASVASLVLWQTAARSARSCDDNGPTCAN
ncbi:MAG: hypothetical protein KC417_08725, partial [Myxococcales bacterium]|nr:hypothetical protein [Myxococcales bacterium]